MTTTAPPALAEYLRTLPGRCSSCLWHVPSMGHAPGCGDIQRDEAFGQLDASKDAEAENSLLRREILAIAHRKMEFTADDLPAQVRETTNPNRRGRVFAALVESGQLRVVGQTKSRNPRAHGKTVHIYRLVVSR